jgi:glycosidase
VAAEHFRIDTASFVWLWWWTAHVDFEVAKVVVDDDVWAPTHVGAEIAAVAAVWLL